MDADTRNTSEELLTAVAETALRGKGAEAALDHFSGIISQALSVLAQNRDDAVRAPPESSSTGSEKLVAELSMPNATELIDWSSSSSRTSTLEVARAPSFAALD